jgi:hypothetical protein
VTLERTGVHGISRDPRTGVLVNTDDQGLEAHRASMRQARSQRVTSDRLAELERRVGELEDLLRGLTAREGGV